MEFGLKRPRAFSAIHMDAYFMIRSIPNTRIRNSTWCEFSGRNGRSTDGAGRIATVVACRFSLPLAA